MANIRTFKNLQDEVLAWLDEAGDTDVTLTLVKQAIRAAHEKRLTEERWAFMLSRPTLLASSAATRFYTLDAECSRLMYVKNLTTQTFLTEYVDQNIMDTGSDWSVDIATATQFTMLGRQEVQNQPTSASVIAVTSSSSGDLTTSVTIRGVTTSGVQSETILVNASGLLSFSELLKVTKSDGWVGTMTLKSNAGAVTNLNLAASEMGRSYPVLELMATPSATESLEYRFYRQPSPLSANNDRPDYPAPFEELLVWEALCDLATYNTYSDSMVMYWASKRDALLLAMHQTAQAQTINQQAVYTDYVSR